MGGTGAGACACPAATITANVTTSAPVVRMNPDRFISPPKKSGCGWTKQIERASPSDTVSQGGEHEVE